MLKNSEDNLHDKSIRFFICFYVMICSFFQSSNSLAYVGIAQKIDSTKNVFDQVEILKWARQNEKAIVLLKDFIDLDNNKKNDIVHAYNELAENNRWLRNYKQALNILEKVENEYLRDSSLEKIELLRSTFYKGKIFRSLGILDSVQFYHNRALFLADTFEIKNNSIVGEIWMDLAFTHTNLIVDRQKALEYNTNALNNYIKTLDVWDIKFAQVFYELASNYRTLGDFERAINYARMAEIIYKHRGDLFDNLIMYSKVIQGNCYFDNKNYVKANKIFDEIVEIYPESAKGLGDSFSRILISSGATLLELGKYLESKDVFEQSISFNPVEDNEDSLSLVYSLKYLAQNMEELNQHGRVKDILGNALLISTGLFGEKHFEVYDCYRQFGIYYEELNQYEDALYFYQKSLVSGFNDFNDENVYSIPSSFDSIPKEAAFNIIFDKARIFKKKYTKGQKNKDLVAAYDLYKTAYQLIRKIANSNMMEESLLNIPENFHDDLNYGIECALSLYEITNNQKYMDQLLQFVETNKYFILQNSIAKSTNRNTLGIPDSVYQQERILQQKINSLKQEINNTIFNDDSEEYEKRLALLNTIIEWENIRKIWNTTDSQNFSLSDISTSISIEGIKDHILDEHDLLLEYFQTSDTLYTIAINKVQEKIIRLAKNPVLDTHLQNYIWHLFYKDTFTSKADYIKFVVAAQYLYNNLVRPATSIMDMDDTDENSRLIIVPDAQFSNVPFESFIQEPTDTTYINYYGLHYVCQDFTIDYAYAINLLDNNISVENKHGKEGILALSYSSTDEKNEMASRNDEYGELPYSALELRNIRKWISNGNFFDGEQATESIFKSNAQNYDIIHLALHGIGDTLDMLNSHLIFKAPGNEIEDGFLYAHELYGMDLSGTELAVLSACETGIGKTMQGEGVYSLARGFAYAGCPTIVMSLWKVDDASTSELMNYFYKNLSNGMPKDKALQKAKLAFLNKANDLSAHPANWAAFIALGNNEPIDIPGQTFKWYYWVILIVIIGASLIVYRNIQLRKIDST